MTYSNTTAQVLRGVHLVLCESKKVSELPFILTNSSIWEFGKAKRMSDQHQIQVTSVHNYLIFNLVDKEGYAYLVTYIANLMKEQQETLLLTEDK